MARRYKKLSITLDIVKAVAQNDAIRVKNLNPLPKDVRIVNAYIERCSGIPDDWLVLHIILQSESFNEVAEDSEVPMYPMPFEQMPERQYPKITYIDNTPEYFLDGIPDSSPFRGDIIEAEILPKIYEPD